MTRRVLITGSRDWTDEKTIEDLIAGLSHDDVVIHGHCLSGADHIADCWAWHYGIRVERYPAEWTKHGPAAGPMRNTKMVAQGRATEAHAYPLPGSKGTWDCVRKCEAAGIPVTVHKPVKP
jgi:hypothetical protein